MAAERRTGVGFLPSLLAGRQALYLALLMLACWQMLPCVCSAPTWLVSRDQIRRPMLPLLCVDGCCGGSSGYVDLSYCVPLGMLRSYLRALFLPPLA